MNNGKLMKNVKTYSDVRLLCNVAGQIITLPFEKYIEAWKKVETWENCSMLFSKHYTQKVSGTYSYHRNSYWGKVS